MGDGMLCVFGFELESRGDGSDRGDQVRRHALQAVQCAARIQQENIAGIMKAQESQEAVFPLRIGINTTGVYIGNLGGAGGRMDLTVIGNGVNFAQRLEAACDRHMVMLGASTRDLVQSSEATSRLLRKRHIRVKHSEELVEAYELDPFLDDPKLLLDGDEAYRQYIGVERTDVRWPIPYPGLIRVQTNYGDGELVNFSFDGFTVKLSEYYAKDVCISLALDTIDGGLARGLADLGLVPLVLEVRWARPAAGGGYAHGCLIKNLNRDQRDAVIDLLRHAIQQHGALRKSA
jgi:hypothetical protein